MLEIILLVVLCRRIGLKALNKGQEKGRWQLFTVLAWIGFEVIGLMISLALNPHNMIMAGIFGPVFGFGGYLLMNYRLDQMPDKKEDMRHWMDRIGQDDQP